MQDLPADESGAHLPALEGGSVLASMAGCVVLLGDASHPSTPTCGFTSNSASLRGAAASSDDGAAAGAAVGAAAGAGLLAGRLTPGAWALGGLTGDLRAPTGARRGLPVGLTLRHSRWLRHLCGRPDAAATTCKANAGRQQARRANPNPRR